jgi:hypothetical protein
VKVDVLADVCAAVAAGDMHLARETARAGYPHVALGNAGRRYTELERTQIFTRDGFIDRYSGARLVFPGTLRLLSLKLPAEFPFHPNWKMDVCHPMYWELYPTIDHVQPVARGGSDSAENWVCTSMLRNGAKANWTLEELGWELLPGGEMTVWDGLLGWFIERTAAEPGLEREDKVVRTWLSSARRCGAADE